MAIMYIPGVGNVNVGNNVQSGLNAGGQVVSSINTPTPTYSAGTYTGNGNYSGNTHSSGSTPSSTPSLTPTTTITEKEKDDNKNYNYTYSPLKSNYDNVLDYYKADNAYRVGLLNPYNLPGFTSTEMGQYNYVDIPIEGKSSSRDLIKAPTFTTDDAGNIVRTDYTQSGVVNTTIPNLGGYRKTGSGVDDPDLGDVYNRQVGMFGAQGKFMRGDNIGTDPSWFDPSGNSSWLDKALAVTKGEGDYNSLLPSDDFYTDFINGTSSGYGGGGGGSNNSSTTEQTSLTPSSDAVVVANRPSDPAYYQEVNTNADEETLLRQQRGDTFVDNLPLWQKQAILASMRRLRGGV